MGYRNRFSRYFYIYAVTGLHCIIVIFRVAKPYPDVKLPSILWSDRVSRFEESLLNVGIVFFAQFLLQFDGLRLSIS